MQTESVNLPKSKEKFGQFVLKYIKFWKRGFFFYVILSLVHGFVFELPIRIVSWTTKDNFELKWAIIAVLSLSILIPFYGFLLNRFTQNISPLDEK